MTRARPRGRRRRPGDQALADDAAQSGGQRQPHLALLEGWEQVDAAVDGLGGGQRVLEGLGVADLADQDDVGVLAHGGPHGDGEVAGVDPDLALVDHAQLVGVEDLDRVLDGAAPSRPSRAGGRR
jgi:hypothetical protein